MTLYKHNLQIWQHNKVYMTNNQQGREKFEAWIRRRDKYFACKLPGKLLTREGSTPKFRFCWSRRRNWSENTELLILSSTLVSRSRHNLNTLRPDGPSIKYPQFPDILNVLNVQHSKLLLITVWHISLCSWARNCRNCM